NSPGESHGSDHTHECALLRNRRKHLVVRWRHGPNASLRRKRRCCVFPPGAEGRMRQASSRLLQRVQAMGRRLFLPEASLELVVVGGMMLVAYVLQRPVEIHSIFFFD